MSADLHARLVAALDEERARAEAATLGPWRTSEEEVQDLHFGPLKATVLHGPDVYSLRPRDAEHIAAQDPFRTLARVAADRRVLERHQWHVLPLPFGPVGCDWDSTPWPCPDIRDLAARYGIKVQP